MATNTYAVPARILRVLFIDHQNYPHDFSVMWTLDGETWAVGRDHVSKASADAYLLLLMQEELDKANVPEVRVAKTFFDYIPSDWMNNKTRVVR